MSLTLTELIRGNSAEEMVPQDQIPVTLDTPTPMSFAGYRWDISKENDVQLVLIQEKPGQKMSSTPCETFPIGTRMVTCFEEFPITLSRTSSLYKGVYELLGDSETLSNTERTLALRRLNAQWAALYDDKNEIGFTRSSSPTDRIFLSKVTP